MEFVVIEIFTLPDISADNEGCFSDLRVWYLPESVGILPFRGLYIPNYLDSRPVEGEQRTKRLYNSYVVEQTRLGLKLLRI